MLLKLYALEAMKDLRFDSGNSVMGKTLQEKLSSLPQERQDRIRQQAEQWITEELSLRDLRVARQLTQEKLAERLQMRQESVSRLEKRSDLHLSTLREVIQAMGGELRLVVEFPDRPPIVLSGFQESTPTAPAIETI
jgi:DNA-binding Xre family transcriptional regulator